MDQEQQNPDALGQNESVDAWLSRTAQQQKKPLLDSPSIGSNESLADWMIRRQKEDDGMTLAFNQGIRIPPDRAARILKAQIQTGYSPEFIDRNLDETEAQVRRYGYDIEKLRKDSPLTARFLQENPTRVGLFSAVDLKGLTDVERLLANGEQPAILKPRSDDVLLKQAQVLGIKKAATDYPNQPPEPKVILTGTEGDLGQTEPWYASQEEMAQAYTDQEFKRLKSVEDFVTNPKQVGFFETLKHRLSENPLAPVPFVSELLPIASNVNLIGAANRFEKNQASPEDIQALQEYARMQLALQYRGSDVGGKIAETALGILPFAGEVAATAGFGAAGKRLIMGGVEEASAGLFRKTLAKIAGALVQLGPAGITAIPEHVTQRMLPKGDLSVNDKGEVVYTQTPGESKALAIPTAVVSRFADQFSAELFGLWSAKVPGATEAMFKQSIAKEGVKEVMKFIGMGEVSNVMKAAVGAQPWQTPLVIRAMAGDKTAQDELIATTVVGGAMGAAGAIGNNRRVAEFNKQKALFEAAQANVIQYGEMLAKAGDTVKGMEAQKKAPEVVDQALRAQTEDAKTYVDAHKFEDVYLQQGKDPHAVAMELTGKPTALRDALELGQQLQIPTASFISKIAATDQAKLFQGEARSNPLDPTLSDVQRHLADIDQQMEAERKAKAEAVKKPAGEPAGEQVPSGIAEEMARQAEAAGRPKQEASAFGKIIETVYGLFGKRGQTTPQELAAKYGPVVQAAKIEPVEPGLEQKKTQEGLHSKNWGLYVPTDITGDKSLIQLLPGANASTLGHEPSHMFLDILADLAQKNPPADIETGHAFTLKEDFQKFLDWRGIKDPEAWQKMSLDEKRPHHEAWADAYEQWLWEGKAPSKGLRNVFHNFRVWISRVYDALVGKGVVIPESIRGVFERMHATDAEIQAAKERLGRLEPFLEGAPNLVFKPAELEKMAQLEAEASRVATEKVDAEALSDIKQEQSEQYQHAKEEIRKEVTQEFEATKEAKALSYFRDWTNPDGSPLPEGMPLFKLSAEDIKRRYGLDPKSFPKGVLDSDFKESDGIDPELAAGVFGFSNGEELVKAIINTDKEAWINAETEARATRTLENPIETLPEEARAAIHNDAEQRLNVYQMEWLARNKLPERNDLIRKFTDPVRYIKELRDYAERRIADISPRDLDPRVYEAAERDARKAAREAILKNDITGAIAFKERETLNHELAKAAFDGQTEAKKISDYGRSFETKDMRQMLGKAGPEYLDVADNITGQYEFRDVPAGVEQSRAILDQFIKEKTASGEDLGEHLFTPEFMDKFQRTNWKDLRLSDLRALGNVLTHLETMARATHRMLSIDRRLTFDGVRGEFKKVLLGMKEQPLRASRSAETFFEKAADLGKKLDASLLKLEQMVREADGGDLDGPFHKYIMYGAADAQARELDYRKKVDAEIARGIDGLPKEQRERLKERIALPNRRVITRWDTLGFGAQAGNASNWSKFLRGEAMRRGGFTEAEISKFVGDLTKEEKDLIQHFWDLKEPVWKEAKDLYRDLTGLEPESVKPEPQHAAFAGYRGGHMPVIYDSRASRQGERQTEAMIGDMTTSGWRSATMSSGYTMKRIEDFAAPMDTDLHHLPVYMGQIIKDLTHRKWMLDVNKILNDKELSELFRDRLGSAKYNRIREVVKEIVNDRNQSSLASLSGWRKFLMALRLNMATAAIGFKIPTLLHHVTSLEGAIGEIGAGYMAKGLAKTLQSPKESYARMIEESGEMRHFAETGDAAIKDIYEMTSGQESKLNDVRRAAAHLVGMANLTRAMPTYWGAKMKAMDTLPERFQGAEREKMAIRAAEETVRLTIGAGAAKDRAAVLSPGNDFLKFVTMFYTPGSTLYNRIHDTVTGYKRTKDVPQLISRVMWTGIIAAVTQQLVAGHPPDDRKDEEWGTWFLKNEATYPFSSVPVLRELADLAKTGHVSTTQNPVIRDAEQILHVGSAFKKAYEGDIGLGRLAEETARSSQWFLGVPADQLFTTGDYMYDLAEGDAQADDFWHFWKDVQRYKRKH